MAHKHRLASLFFIAGMVSILFFAAASANAQGVTETPIDTSFSTQLFKPSPGPQNFFAVESPEIGDDMMPYVGLLLTYQHRPFALIGCSDASNCSDNANTIDAVKYFLSADIMASFNFLKRFQVGLAIPLTLYQSGSEIVVATDGTNSWAEAGDTYKAFRLGDIRLHLKGRILGEEGKNGPVLSAAVITSFPIAEWIGNDQSEDTDEGAYGYGGEGFLTFEAPKIMFGWRFFDKLRFAIDVGALWRQQSTMLSVELGNALTYSGAIAYLVTSQIEVIAELYGQKSFVSENFSDLESAPLLFNGGARFLLKDFLVHVAVGGGIISGVGVPQFQVVLGGAWAPKKKKKEEPANAWDKDNDGIENNVDKCPKDAEDMDGFQDEDGCPDPDNDQDGIIDGYDSCPMEPEDKDGFRDEDGCPDLDHDEDGIKEPDDKCPDNAEDFDDFQDEDGCPEADNDQDGFLDTADFCPDDPEDKDGFQDDDGCPDLDNDGDGVADALDRCPDKPETLNGYKDKDGCPDKGKALVIVTENKIELKEMIQFKTGSDVIKGKRSFKILGIVSGILKGNTLLRVSIEGHSDNRGRATKNRELSKKRADAVKAYLLQQGIDETRLETAGWGPDKPIKSNRTKAGREANRRVEFVIIHKQVKVVDAADDEAVGDDSEAEMDFSADPNADSGDEAEMDFSADSDDEAEMDFSAE